MGNELRSMNKATKRYKSDGGPAIIRFKARLFRNPKAVNSDSATGLKVGKGVSEKLRGVTKVEGTINGHPFRAPLERDASGSCWFRVNKAMREGAHAGAGDTVNLAILGPEPEPSVPADLRSAFKAFPEAKALWQQLDADARRIWIRWIESAKKPLTRARRVTRTVEQLSSGKRRPCCVNVYEFMMQRVGE